MLPCRCYHWVAMTRCTIYSSSPSRGKTDGTTRRNATNENSSSPSAVSSGWLLKASMKMTTTMTTTTTTTTTSDPQCQPKRKAKATNQQSKIVTAHRRESNISEKEYNYTTQYEEKEGKEKNEKERHGEDPFRSLAATKSSAAKEAQHHILRRSNSIKTKQQQSRSNEMHSFAS